MVNNHDTSASGDFGTSRDDPYLRKFGVGDVGPASSRTPPDLWGLDDLEPGPVLAALLSSIDVGQVSGHDRVRVMCAHQRLASHYEAQVYRDMVSVVDVLTDDERVDDEFDDGVAAMAAETEIRLALRLTRHSAGVELSFALQLVRRLPMVFERMVAGELDIRRARTIERHTNDLPDSLAREVVEQVLDRAPELTTGQLGALLRRVRIDVDAERADARYRSALEQRMVYIDATPDGTANLHALDLPPDRAASLMDLINATARDLPSGPDDLRTMDQKRADVFLDLLDTRRPDAATTRRGRVDICVDLDTLARMSDHPGDLAGYGPVVADITRRVTEDMGSAEWRFAVTHPESQQPLVVGTTRHRTTKRFPNAAQRRLVETRNRTCVFPGCRMPATSSDIDHTTRWADSHVTDTDRLAPLCRRDHCIRHQIGLVYERLPDGDLGWTTRLGHRYTTSGRSP